MEEHTFVTVNGLRVKIKMSYHVISYHIIFVLWLNRACLKPTFAGRWGIKSHHKLPQLK